jgi:CheY-like chemotaxis protein
MLVDGSLPGGRDGLWVAGELQKQHGVAVILVTARCDDRFLARLQEIAPCGYLEKPIQPEALGTAILMALYLHYADRVNPETFRPVVALAQNQAVKATAPGPADFRTCFCAVRNCAPENYADRVLLICLYFHALPFAVLFWPWRRICFARDYDLIEQVGSLKCEVELALELRRLRTANWLGGPLRRFFGLRVSSRSLEELMAKVFAECARAEAGRDRLADPPDPDK